MDIYAALLFVLGLAALLLGAELLVRGASRLAALLGVPPLVVGLTVVAFGTSAPELVVSTRATLAGQADIALGNVVGSNIFNILFILGLAALIVPLRVDRKLVRLDVPLMIAVSLALVLMALDGAVGRLESLLLLAGGLVYTLWTVREGRRESSAEEMEGGREEKGGTLSSIVLILLGLGLLVLGSRWLLDGALDLARALGVSELIIGLTLIAAGTSLPEVATSVVAGLRGERDIAVGNVVGSNIFNILIVLGFSGALAPAGIAVSAEALRFDMPVMLAVAISCLPIFFTGHLIARWEGALFLAYYLAYTAYLVLGALGHEALFTLRLALLFFALPLTALTLVVLALRALHRRKEEP